ncbi:unnamed protein product [Alopecurus aequalis]
MARPSLQKHRIFRDLATTTELLLRPTPLMELLVLLALLLLGGLSVFIRRRTAHPALAVVSDPAVAHGVLIDDADAFADRPVPHFVVTLARSRGGQRNENISSAPHGPHWRALRRNITSETLHPSRLGPAHLAPLHRDAIQDLVAALSAGARAGKVVALQPVHHIRTSVFRVAVRLCFGDGVDERHVRAICSEVHGTQVAIGGVQPSMLARLAEWIYLGRLLAFHDRVTALCLPLIAARRRRTRDDELCRPYVDSLIDLRVREGCAGGARRALRDNEIVDLVLEFLGASTGSSVACLEWTLAHLVAQPEVQERLRREVDGAADGSQQLIRGMPYLHAVILESLRMHPPTPVAVRHVQADAAATLTTAVPADGGLTVLFHLGDMGRDGKTWKDPHEFRPERFLPGGDAEGVGPLPGPKEARMMPFGAGHRFCPGVGLAMATIKCFLAALVREFEWAPPTTNGAVDFTELDGFLKTMRKPLSARLTPRTK